MVWTQFRAMGSRISVAMDAAEAVALPGLADVAAWYGDWERRLSRFLPESELSRLNSAAGRPVVMSDGFVAALQAALAAAQATAGLVTPTILDALLGAGYDRSFEFIRQEGAGSANGAVPTVGDWRQIRLDADRQIVSLPIGMQLDLGGTAKGWSADLAAQRLAGLGPVLVDAGGDIAISGPWGDGEPWQIAVTDPLNPDETCACLAIERGGVATSGRDYRRWDCPSGAGHHIIDPRTGRPAVSDVLTATVVAPTALAADVAAKMVMILGSEAGLDWLGRHSDLAGLVVLTDGTVLETPSLEPYLWP